LNTDSEIFKRSNGCDGGNIYEHVSHVNKENIDHILDDEF